MDADKGIKMPWKIEPKSAYRKYYIIFDPANTST